MDYRCELKDGETSLPIVNVTNSDIMLKKRQAVKRGDLEELQDTDEEIISQCVVHYVQRGEEVLSTINMEEVKVGPSVAKEQTKELYVLFVTAGDTSMSSCRMTMVGAQEVNAHGSESGRNFASSLWQQDRIIAFVEETLSLCPTSTPASVA
ncbi:hypothetical protein HPB47_000718 [Ixodes persulcatus]|uniref:Uncharacterized protein n=1 Tax=Ixodes persulcatus TaxID=34615 RepID=A0AC60PRP6_IXOPE|nr:hypothetical protein HPB47_000718 [Ixodes persulcatus]